MIFTLDPTEPAIHGTHGTAITFHQDKVYAAGPQPLTSLPGWLVVLFADNPEVEHVALGLAGSESIIYSRIEEFDSLIGAAADEKLVDYLVEELKTLPEDLLARVIGSIK